MDNEKTTPETVETTEQPVEATVAEEKKPKKASKTAELEKKLAAKEEELSSLTDQYQRMLAEYANYKRRTEQEKMQIGLFTKAELLTELLVSVDNMKRPSPPPTARITRPAWIWCCASLWTPSPNWAWSLWVWRASLSTPTSTTP